MKKWLKLTFVATGLAVAVGAGICACASKQAVVARAEEEIVEPVVEEEQPVEEESWAEKAYHTFIIPIISGISAVSLFSVITCVGTTIIKSKLLDNKLAELDKKKNEILELAEQKYNETCEKLVEVQEVLVIAREVHKYLVDSKVLNENTNQYVNKCFDEMKKVDKLQQAVQLLIKMVADIELKNPEAVKSGIAEDIKRIAEIATSI